jgi:hypothetical protein
VWKPWQAVGNDAKFLLDESELGKASSEMRLLVDIWDVELDQNSADDDDLKRVQVGIEEPEGSFFKGLDASWRLRGA